MYFNNQFLHVVFMCKQFGTKIDSTKKMQQILLHARIIKDYY